MRKPTECLAHHKWTNSCIMPEGEEKEKGAESLFKKKKKAAISKTDNQID